MPLVYRPAIKAALLDTRLLSQLGELLGMVVPRLAAPEEAAEAAAVCTMVMEAAVVLCNPEVCLDPLAPTEQRELEDTPRLAEVGGPVHLQGQGTRPRG